ncbi:MAG TPA: ABC transporter ATP-binding protein [Candidatus Acetothermia bacterium]|nr:ABC transporter ATP-binding protein [Candidatus Acetothermia bacterium]
MSAEVSLQGLTKVFRSRGEEVVAVDHLDLSVNAGELVTLLGPSGCGKTTTLRLVGGFEIPDGGRVYIGGRDVTDLPPQKRDTATVFQSYGLFPHMTVFENVAFGLKLRRLSRREIHRRVSEALRLVNLEGLERRYPRELSGGQQQRVALCRALVVEPEVLLFDEPLSNLDAKLRIETREQIRRIQREVGITSIYVTHDQAEAMAISDRVAVMNAGRIQQLGDPYEIYAHPANRFVADFIGRANFLEADVLEATDGTFRVRLSPGVILEVPAVEGLSPGERAVAVIRPEAMDILPPGEGDIDARVIFAHYTGSLATYRLELPNGETVEAEVLSPREHGFLSEGAEVGIRFHRQSIHLLRE